MENGKWVTIEDDVEYITLVHESDCRHQRFDSRKGEYVCTRCGELCSEECPKYSGLQGFLNEYEDIPIEGIEAPDLRIIYGSKSREKDPYEGLSEKDLLSSDDYELLNYLRTEVWN